MADLSIHILEAVRLGLVPRVTRRLTGHERTMIRPGTVWVWEEGERLARQSTDSVTDQQRRPICAGGQMVVDGVRLGLAEVDSWCTQSESRHHSQWR